MAVITFSKPVSFPIAPLRDMLAKHVPLYRWQCGEEDNGGPRDMGSFREHGIISGRSDGTIIFTEYRAHLAQFPGAPAHEWYLELFAPTTELQPIAERITAVICAAVMEPDERHAHCRLIPGGPWLSAQAMPGILRAITAGATLADAVAVAGPGAPRHDTLEPPPAPIDAGFEGVLRDFVARVGPRDETGMSDVIRGMLAENEATKAVSRTVQGPLDPKLADSDRLLARLKHDADGTSAEAIEAMQDLLRNPPSPGVIASAANPFAANLMKMIAHEQSTGALPTPARPVVPPGAPPLVRRLGGFGRKGL